MPATLTPPATQSRLAKPLMTAEEFYQFCQRPENQGCRHELVRGEVIEMPQPNIAHGWVTAQFATEFTNYCRTHEVGFAVVESGVLIERNPDTVRGPDAALYPLQNGKRFIPKKWSVIPPTIAVEVLSPNDRHAKVSMKISEYLTNGVKEVWIADPDEQNVVIHFPDQPPTVFERDSTLTTILLPEFSIKLSLVFDEIASEDETP